MESLYLWPANPAASLLVLAILAQVFLYAARHPMHRAFAALGRLLSGGFRVAARFCKSVSTAIAQRDREMLADAGKGDAEARIAAQLSNAERARHATLLIDNSAPLEETLKLVEQRWDELAAAGKA